MLIERMICPFGCANATLMESTKQVVTGNSNLLLDSSKLTAPVTETVKIYSCNCCGRSFESHQPSDGRMVI